MNYLPVRIDLFFNWKILNLPPPLKFFQLLKHSILFHILKFLYKIFLCLEYCLCWHFCLTIHLTSLEFFITFSQKPALNPLSLPLPCKACLGVLLCGCNHLELLGNTVLEIALTTHWAVNLALYVSLTKTVLCTTVVPSIFIEFINWFMDKYNKKANSFYSKKNRKIHKTLNEGAKER